MSYFKRKNKQLKRKFHVNVVDAFSLAQHSSHLMSGWRIVWLVGGTGVGLVAATTVLIFFTGIRTLIPGYTDDELKSKQASLLQKVQKLDREIAERDSMIQSIKLIAETTPSGAASQVLTPQQNPAGGDVAGQTAATPQAPAPQPAFIRRAALSNDDAFRYNFVNPVEGFLTNRFAPERSHYAIDLVAAQNSPIRAVSDGYVVFSEYTTETGHVIGVYHRNQFLSFYKHNRTLLKKVGSFVHAGEIIAVIGNSGENSTGPHLHFELWHRGKPVDPLLYLTYKR